MTDNDCVKHGNIDRVMFWAAWACMILVILCWAVTGVSFSTVVATIVLVPIAAVMWALTEVEVRYPDDF